MKFLLMLALLVCGRLLASGVVEEKMVVRVVSMPFGQWMKNNFLPTQPTQQISDQDFIKLAVEMMKKQDLPGRLVIKEDPKTNGELVSGVLTGWGSFVYEGYKKEPRVVGTVATGGSILGGGVGWILAAKLSACYGLETVGVGVGIPPGWTPYVIPTLGSVLGLTVGSGTGATCAAWAVLSERELREAYINGFNKGVRSHRLVIKDLIKFNEIVRNSGFKAFLGLGEKELLQRFLT